MPVEIERKFLVKNLSWKKNADSILYIQGYLCNEREKNVRVRVAGEKAFITVKGGAQYISRAEFEYPVPVEDALYMLHHLCEAPLIEKTRHFVKYEGLLWEVDEFAGENLGLIIAEVELQTEDQEVPMPDWVGSEVTGNERYYNANLIRNPYKMWKST